eukprot:GHRR01005640.1.p2 GENE.GHRR01005640.1~~GHRR01005640.1.p2  ORF type:complete len:114 (-),score=33.21 GHRR01005640.1:608-949(-)
MQCKHSAAAEYTLMLQCTIACLCCSNASLIWLHTALQMSNDLLRDHVWNLLRPKHMLKWTQRHIVRYSFNYEKTEIRLQHPLPYTPCVQQLVDDVWLLPSADREGQWLCCKPV